MRLQPAGPAPIPGDFLLPHVGRLSQAASGAASWALCSWLPGELVLAGGAFPTEALRLLCGNGNPTLRWPARAECMLPPRRHFCGYMRQSEAILAPGAGPDP